MASLTAGSVWRGWGVRRWGARSAKFSTETQMGKKRCDVSGLYI